VEMQGISRASLRRYVEQEAAAHFRPEVLARFTSVLVFGHLDRAVQVRICERMVEREIEWQSEALTRRFGHGHRVIMGPGVCARLVGEGWHRRLGARPMRNVVERRVRGALVESQLRGSLGPGVGQSVLLADQPEGIRAAIARSTFTL
jgi:ATP-dependent Clp protease ATP-binding subunit ClpA